MHKGLPWRYPRVFYRSESILPFFCHLLHQRSSHNLNDDLSTYLLSVPAVRLTHVMQFSAVPQTRRKITAVKQLRAFVGPGPDTSITTTPTPEIEQFLGEP